MAARKAPIVDASIAAAPRQRNRHEENAAVNAGQTPSDWS